MAHSTQTYQYQAVSVGITSFDVSFILDFTLSLEFNYHMPPHSLVEKNRTIALEAIIAVLNFTKSKSPNISFSSLASLLKHSLFRLRKLASICGVTLFTFLASEKALANQGSSEPKRFKSSVAYDFDSDGDIDIANANPDSGEVSLIQNNFSSFDRMSLPADIHADLISAYDIDNDGDQDIVVLNQDSGDIQVLENRGSEGFSPHQSSNLGQNIEGAVLADMNQQPGGEVVYSSPNVFGIAKNNGTEGFVPSSDIPTGGIAVEAFEVADFDNDGDNDVIFSQLGAPGIAVSKNQGSENFDPVGLNSEISNVSDFAIADIDSDGDNDIIYATNYPPMVGVSKNDGSEKFLPTQLITDDISSIDQLEVADLDDDNDLDIVAASSESGDKYILENQGSEGFSPISLG